MDYQGIISTALQFVTSFRQATILGVGHSDHICWTSVDIDIDGSEFQHFYVMEQRIAGHVEVRVIQNMGAVELAKATIDVAKFWAHPRAHTPQH